MWACGVGVLRSKLDFDPADYGDEVIALNDLRGSPWGELRLENFDPVEFDGYSDNFGILND